MSKNKYSVGLLMLLAGVVILLGKLGVFSFIGSLFWPLVVLVPGVLLHVLYFGRMLPSIILIPGGILIAYGLLFAFCNLFGWHHLQVLWPIFFIGAAIGFYEYYLFEVSRPRNALLAALVLVGIAVVCFLFMLLWSWGVYFIAIVLIVAGGWLAFGRRLRW